MPLVEMDCAEACHLSLPIKSVWNCSCPTVALFSLSLGHLIGEPWQSLGAGNSCSKTRSRKVSHSVQQCKLPRCHGCSRDIFILHCSFYIDFWLPLVACAGLSSIVTSACVAICSACSRWKLIMCSYSKGFNLFHSCKNSSPSTFLGVYLEPKRSIFGDGSGSSSVT